MNCSFERAEMRSKDEEEHRMTERERVIQIVDALAPELKTLALNIHDNPELVAAIKEEFSHVNDEPQMTI